jgi:apolipoprotein N-acyltransferase
MTRLPSRQSIVPALVSGVLLCLSLPGSGGLWPLLFVALVPLLAVLPTAKPGQAVRYGLATGMVHYLTLLYWIVIVLGRYGGLPWYFSYPALLLLAFVLSLFFVVFTVAARYLLVESSPFLALWALPCIWVGLDWVRSFLFTGFPWMDLGYGLWNVPRLIQVSDITGHYGVTFIILLINSLAALLLTERSKTARLAVIAPVVGLLLAVGGYSAWRWQSLAGRMQTTIPIGVVQGNVEQDKKWLPEEQRQTVMGYIRQTVSLFNRKKPSLVVWPETALPFFPEDNPLTADLRQLTSRNRIGLLTGAPWYTLKDPRTRKFLYYNSALLINSEGDFAGQYFKIHLVPFGEYVPIKKYLWFLAPLVQTVGDFTPGKIEKPIAFRKAKIGVLLCYESIFADLAEKWVKAGANVLINLTNDAWYGKSSAPHQSFAMTVFRAVETRRSVVRAANTGISGFIDPLGRVQMQSEIFVPWQASEDVVLNDEVTFVVRYGHLFAPLCLFWGFCMLLNLRLRRMMESKSSCAYP